MTEEDVIEQLDQACRSFGGRWAWAREKGISPRYVCNVLNGYTKPGKKITAALGLQRVVSYERKNRRS